ncbi:lactate dehydrogenase-like 2-hydroxyacid dehydrogenase [Motilibacter rhizosphaerae]|uniref:Lactate dehydrogenase-like 2-hydroxyacid dehydrogenase n=1 Tax=Motilibacter rhizosphaerae TaxID=598652 RepID=A0A4Q7NS46_9ACTN|nr:D-2-hydroxyacid dehydrogenase family protein [Motilibacter rhizosphaerae]RZS89598.1 lactate dehydrogenase-like 2-hydroxyacid dehydrogenase [Motilibacter rhizosphaerae]
MRVVVLDDYQDVARSSADWGSLDAEVVVEHEHLGPEELVARHRGADVLVLMRERTPVDAALLDALPEVRLLVTTGMRNASVDLDAARERGVAVCGTEGSASSAAELAWALVLDLAHRVTWEDAALRTGRWQTGVGRDLAGLTLGVVGLGRLGRRVAAYALAFGMEVLAWSQHLTAEAAAHAGAALVPKDELLERADVVSVHVVLSERTRGLLGAAELARMKPGALLVNTSRGPVVDEAALVDALSRGHLGGAGLDVFDREPLPLDSPLRTAPRTVLTPHIGYVTDQVYRQWYAMALEDVAAWQAGAPVRQLA